MSAAVTGVRGAGSAGGPGTGYLYDRGEGMSGCVLSTFPTDGGLTVVGIFMDILDPTVSVILDGGRCMFSDGARSRLQSPIGTIGGGGVCSIYPSLSLLSAYPAGRLWRSGPGSCPGK